MNLKNKTIKKFIPSILIISILTPSFLFLSPKSTNAIPVVVVEDTSKAGLLRTIKSVIIASSGVNTSVQTSISSAADLKQWAREVLELVLTNLAKRFMQKMTESTVNWINSGFHGAPLFLERPGSFFKDIAKYEIRNLVGSIGYDSGRFPFGKTFLINAINGYKRTFEQNAQYTLSRVTNDPSLLYRVQNDFGYGGWDGFFINTQFQQNNFIGSQLMYADHLSERLAGTYENEAEQIQKAIAQGQGFLSPQKCETNPNFNKFRNQFQQPSFKCSLPPPVPGACPPDMPPPWRNNDASVCNFLNRADQFKWERACATEREGWEQTNACPDRPNGTSGFVRTTPGSVVADQIMDSLTSGKRQGELAIAMGNSLSAIFDALLNQLFQKGLNALSSKENPPAPTDNFDYYGNSLGPSTTTGVNNTFRWIPERETDLDTQILPYKTDGSEYVKWKSPTDEEALQNINNTPPYIPTTTCPAGQIGTPPNCAEDPFLGPPQEAD